MNVDQAELMLHSEIGVIAFGRLDLFNAKLAVSDEFRKSSTLFSAR